MPNLNTSILSALPFVVPPLSEQRAIAAILGALDDKIELNRRLNETLEALARAIFRSWFVDFDPVRAKLEGRQPAGTDAATAALFPDAFEEDEFGERPRDWSRSTFGELAENPRRGVLPRDLAPDLPYIGLEHMPRRSIALSDWGVAADATSNKFAFQQGEILFGKLRPYFHKVGVAPLNGVCSTDILVVRPREPDLFGVVLLYVSSAQFVDFANAPSKGTRMPRTDWNIMSSYPVVIPPHQVVEDFNRVVSPIVDKIRSNILESRALASIRDALLPKLLSGEIRVKDAERLVEVAI